MLSVVGVLASLVTGPRWLRVAQREHYQPTAAGRFVVRWTRSATNVSLVSAAFVASASALVLPAAALLAIAAATAWPLGLSYRGRTSKLRWTPRLRRLAVAAVVLRLLAELAASAAGGAGPAITGLATLSTPAWILLAAACMVPVERRLSQRFVASARARLEQVQPTIVAITGSFGKTSTKGIVAHLLGGRRVLASPASFNNAMGLSITINEHLPDDAEILVAEMGTYGPGEIRAMCSWMRPEIAVITSIGPVHLERMRSVENIIAAKTEITELAQSVVLNVDAPGLASLADHLEHDKRVIRCSSVLPNADVFVERRHGGLVWRSTTLRTESGQHSTNVACAIGVAQLLGVDEDEIVSRLGSIPTTPNRQVVSTAPSGVIIVDDTFNANPAGAASALGVLAALGDERSRRVVVTPGMVELGPIQRRENVDLGRAAATAAHDVVFVGSTNAAALVEGAQGCSAAVHRVSSRSAAVQWVRTNLVAGDVVLYENDLPDHYP